MCLNTEYSYNVGAITLFRKRMKSTGVRKGAWSGEEDMLLKTCIETYGQGKWHLVPQRAGLNRCRKSCRLRWLNYLQPNLNREEFGEDEIDLIIKMHKLFGNRWSLIAGRLPGRTANDIKNYWNSHLSKAPGLKQNASPPQPLKRKRDEVIRPQPRYFKGKKLSEGLIDVNVTSMQEQQEEQNQVCMLTPCEGHNMWLNKLLLEDDEDSSPSSCDSIENKRFLKDYAQETDLKRVQLDGSAFQWDDLLISNDWLMKY